MNIVKAIARPLRPLLTLAIVVVATLMVTGQLRMEPVLTGSMAPHYPPGTLVAVTPVNGRALHVGNVVMFVPPAPWGTPTGGPIMHRVISLKPGPDGHVQVRTKGDANVAADPWVLDADRGGFAQLRGSSVLAGRLLFMIRSTGHFPAVLIWPGLIVLLVGLRRSRRSSKVSADAATGPPAAALHDNPQIPAQREAPAPQAPRIIPAPRDARGRHRSTTARRRSVSRPVEAR